MFLLPLIREKLLHFLPKGGVGAEALPVVTARALAEVGVAEGAFSAPLLEIAAPTRLHLIDPWLFQAVDDYRPDPNNVEDAEQERRYQAVRAMFARDIDAGRVVVRRARSTEAAAAFGDGELDWIYLDAMHTYEAVRDDPAPHSFVFGVRWSSFVDERASQRPPLARGHPAQRLLRGAVRLHRLASTIDGHLSRHRGSPPR